MCYENNFNANEMLFYQLLLSESCIVAMKAKNCKVKKKEFLLFFFSKATGAKILKLFKTP